MFKIFFHLFSMHKEVHPLLSTFHQRPVNISSLNTSFRARHRLTRARAMIGELFVSENDATC